jgi:hypothetical protein
MWAWDDTCRCTRIYPSTSWSGALAPPKSRTNAAAGRCGRILWLLAHGRTATELGSVTGYSAYGIGPIATRYNQQGPAGRHTRQHTTARRATPRVAPQLQEELRQARAGPARPRRRPLAWAHRGRVDGGAAGTPRRALARRDLPAAAHAHAPPRSPPAAPGGG